MSSIPNSIVLDLTEERLLIDGRDFPWYITEEGPTFSGLTDQRTAGALMTLNVIIDPRTIEIVSAPPESDDA